MELTEEQNPNKLCEQCKMPSKEFFEKGHRLVCKECKGVGSIRGKSTSPRKLRNLAGSKRIYSKKPSISQYPRPDGR